MQGKKKYWEKHFTDFRLSDRIPMDWKGAITDF